MSSFFFFFCGYLWSLWIPVSESYWCDRRSNKCVKNAACLPHVCLHSFGTLDALVNVRKKIRMSADK